MNIYIPSHLRKIGVIGKMCEAIQEYANYWEDTESSFDDYYYYLKIDPVKRFLNLCISEDSIVSGENYETVINYLSRLFYSVKGTVKVFEYMRRYLGLSIQGEIIYTTKYIEITLAEISLSDEERFITCLSEFLSALLYYGELRLHVGTINMSLSSDIRSLVSGDVIGYNLITAIPDESSNK